MVVQRLPVLEFKWTVSCWGDDERPRHQLVSLAVQYSFDDDSFDEDARLLNVVCLFLLVFFLLLFGALD